MPTAAMSSDPAAASAAAAGMAALHFYTFGGLKATSEWISEFSGALAMEKHA